MQLQEVEASLNSAGGRVRAVDRVSFTIRRGETFALLGESGCGKSMTALTIMGLLPRPAGRLTGGRILLDGEDLAGYSEQQMRRVRGNRIAMIFQEPMTSLNPVLSVGAQIGEVLREHKGLRGTAAQARIVELLDAVGIPDPERRSHEYPHQLSGGMKQRVMIAIALAGDPDLLIADEPTTALDVTIQAQVLDLMKDIQAKTGMAIMLITHDLGIVADMADHVAVMYAGQIVERRARDDFYARPLHPYSQKLFRALPSLDKRQGTLEVIPGNVPPLTMRFDHCRFAERCDQARDDCRVREPAWVTLEADEGVRCVLYDRRSGLAAPADQGTQPDIVKQPAALSEPGPGLLRVEDLRVHFPIHRGVLRRQVGAVRAVDGVSLEIRRGQTLALVGESGCGKTTAGKGILQLLRRHTGGRVLFDGTNLCDLKESALRSLRSQFQIIFQDPYSSMNPRMRIRDIIEEGMLAQGIGGNARERQQRVDELMRQVGLAPEMKDRYPHEFSGGQRQRICIARALAVEPRLIICDEPTSALDVSVQAQILNLLRRLQQELGLAYLFITHDLSVVSYLAHEVAVMYLGRIVEQGPVEAVLSQPRHPYTRALLSAVPEPDPARQRPVIRLQGDLPSPSHPPQGCHFHPRCPEVMAVCREQYPPAQRNGHMTRCHLYSAD